MNDDRQPPPDAPLPFATRLWFAWVCLVRVLFDGRFAASAFAVQHGAPALSAGPARRSLPARDDDADDVRPVSSSPISQASPPLDVDAARRAEVDGALRLLGILQREGRLVDFLEQEVAPFSDADIGAAARVVHDGCRKALRAHATVVPVRAEDEGARVVLPAGFAPFEVKLTGDVRGEAPYTGTLRHRGWRATAISLPTPTAGNDPHVLAPAEVEL